MFVHISWDGDDIGGKIGRARLTDDVAEVRRVDHAINAGNEVWRSFALRCAGRITEIAGDEGAVEIPADKLSELPAIAQQYSSAVGATVTVGVGMRLSESSKALMWGKLNGKNRVVVWSEDMQPLLDEAAASPKSEKDKLSQEYLNKSNGLEDKDQHTAFAGHSPNDHEEGSEAAKELESAQDEAPAPEGTHAAEDFEAMLHDEASKQGQQDQVDAQAKDSHLDEVKQKLVQVLSSVRQQMPQIQQIQQSAPEVYASLMALTQGLVDLGREVMGPQQAPPQTGDEKPQEVQKSELEKSVSQIQPGKRSIGGPGRLSFDYSHILPEAAKQQGMKMTVTHHAAEPGLDAHLIASVHHPESFAHVGSVTAYLDKDTKAIEPHSDLIPRFRGQGLGQAMYEAAYAHAKNVLGYTNVSGANHSADAHKLHTRLAAKHGFKYNAEPDPDMARHGYPYSPYQYTIKDEMDPSINDDNIIGKGHGVSFHKELEKAAMGAVGGAEAGRAHLNLPAGTVKDGKVKVKKPDGSASWKSVTSGQIQSQTPDAPLLGANSYPVSSRAPGS